MIDDIFHPCVSFTTVNTDPVVVFSVNAVLVVSVLLMKSLHLAPLPNFRVFHVVCILTFRGPFDIEVSFPKMMNPFV